LLAGTGFFLLVFGVLDLYRFFVLLFLVVSIIAIDCLERLVSEMTCYVSSGMLNPTHSLTHAEKYRQCLILSVTACRLGSMVVGINWTWNISFQSTHCT